MDMEATTLTTEELGRSMLARQLIQQHAASRGYPTHGNEATSALFFEWLSLPIASRPASFHEWVIQTLGRP